MTRMLGVRREPLLAAMLYLAVGMLYGQAVPPWEAPDEPWHMAYVEAVAAAHLPTATETYEAHQPPGYYLWPALALVILGRDRVPRAPDNPRYPFATAAYLHPPGEPGAPLVGLVRGFSSLLGVLVVVLTWSAARVAAPRDPHRALVASLLVALWPQLLFIGHSVSNDLLAAAWGALVTYGLFQWASGRAGQLSGALAVGVGLSLGLLTKLNVVALVPAVAVGFVVAGGRWSSRQRLFAVGLGVGMPLATAAALGGLLPAVARQLFAQAVARGLTVRAELLDPVELGLQVLRLVTSLWARFGWLNVEVPLAFHLVAGGLLGLGLVSVARAWPDMRREREAVSVAAVVCLSLLAAAVKNLLLEPQPQGRFLFPALPALAVLLATGWLLLLPPGRRGQLAPVLCTGLVVANLLVTGRWLPRAYAPWRTEPPAVDARVVAVPWQVVARLSDGSVVRQTFHVYRPGLQRVAVAVAQAGGRGRLEIRLVAKDGRVIGGREIAVADVRPNSWLGLDVAPLASAGQDYTLELRLAGRGWVSLWGTLKDIYPEGALWVDGRPVADLMLLTLLATPEQQKPGPALPDTRGAPAPAD